MSIISKIIITLAAKAERYAQAEAYESLYRYEVRRKAMEEPEPTIVTIESLYQDTKAKLWYIDHEEPEEEEVFCDVCGLSYPQEDPCQFH